MHPSVLAKRELDAQNRIMDAAQLLAERFEVEPPKPVQERYPDVAQMARWGAVATFLEALALVEPGPRIGEILEIEGLSKTSIKAIMKHFNLEEADGNSE